MRHIYFDEAGIGDPKSEPFTVVCGIIVKVDEQYRDIVNYLIDLTNRIYLKNRIQPHNFHFHAKDLFHGHGFFPRNQWSLDERLDILGQLADIPSIFDLPIIYTCLKREDFSGKNITKRQLNIANRKAHATCYVNCLNLADKWIEKEYPSEQIFAVVENHEGHKESLDFVTQFLTNPKMREFLNSQEYFAVEPLNNFTDSPLFAKKSGTSPLQIADVCAFTLARALAEGSHIEGTLNKIKPQLVHGFINEFLPTPSHIQL